MTMPLVRAASVYTDGNPNNSHANSCLSRSAKLGAVYVLHDPARPRYCSTAIAVWGVITPLENLENVPTYFGSLLCLTVCLSLDQV